MVHSSYQWPEHCSSFTVDDEGLQVPHRCAFGDEKARWEPPVSSPSRANNDLRFMFRTFCLKYDCQTNGTEFCSSACRSARLHQYIETSSSQPSFQDEGVSNFFSPTPPFPKFNTANSNIMSSQGSHSYASPKPTTGVFYKTQGWCRQKLSRVPYGMV